MLSSNRRHTIDEVLTALRLCGPDYHNGACEKCPFIRDCMPGDNDALVAEAVLTIETLIKLNADTIEQMARFAEFIQNGNVPVYVVGGRSRRGRVKHWIRSSRFRVSDMDKLGKTVFLKKADAENALRRAHHG